ESLGLAELLLAVKKTWPNGVMPRNMVAYIAPDFMPPSEQAREMLGCLEQASGKPLHPISSSSITWVLQKLSAAPLAACTDTVLLLRRISDRRNGDMFRVDQLKA